MPIVKTGPKSNLSKILCPSLLSASLMKIQYKMKSLLSGQHFPKSVGPSVVHNSHANNQNWAKFKAVKIVCVSLLSTS